MRMRSKKRKAREKKCRVPSYKNNTRRFYYRKKGKRPERIKKTKVDQNILRSGKIFVPLHRQKEKKYVKST